jgi:hypothetical protein
MKNTIIAVLFSVSLLQQSLAASAVAYCKETGCYGWAENYTTVEQAITIAKEYCRKSGGRSPEIFLSSSGTGYGAIAYNSGTWQMHASVAYEDIVEACMVSHQNCPGADTDKKIVAVWYDYGGGAIPPSQWDGEEREWVKDLNNDGDILESVLDAYL